MSNATFAKSVDAFRASENKGTSAYGTLVAYAVEVCTLARMDAPSIRDEALGNVLKSAITSDEAAYKAEKRLTEMPVTYRSAKSVIVSAVTLGIPLMDEDGKPVGKSALDKAIKEAKGDGKTEFEKFTSTMATAYKIFAKMDTLSDIQKSKELVRQLADAVLKAEAERMPKAA